MLNFLKQIFTWWHKQTLGTLFTLFLQENLLVKINLVISIIQIKKEKDGLYTKITSNLQKFLRNGIHGYIFLLETLLPII